jgi:hypothetical protein
MCDLGQVHPEQLHLRLRAEHGSPVVPSAIPPLRTGATNVLLVGPHGRGPHGVRIRSRELRTWPSTSSRPTSTVPRDAHLMLQLEPFMTPPPPPSTFRAFEFIRSGHLTGTSGRPCIHAPLSAGWTRDTISISKLDNISVSTCE